MNNKSAISCLILTGMILLIPCLAWAQNNTGASSAKPPAKLTLTHAVVCETIEESAPQNQAVVFSTAIGKVYCFTLFDPVPEKTVIFHSWYHQDTLSTKRKLSLRPPRWGTYSSIQLREADKGAWRVEVTDQNGRILQTLRFSITD